MATSEHIKTALEAPSRTPDDKVKDEKRKPAELLALADIQPGMIVADVMPGQGYFTRLLSEAVGPGGRVYALTPHWMAEKFPKMVTGAEAIAEAAAQRNITARTQNFEGPVAIAPGLDCVIASDVYHDFFGFIGAPAAASFAKSVFAGLKPGGIFIVIDHAAAAGASDSTAKELHRIDPELVKKQVLAAGFVLETESPLLRNANDPHTAGVFTPEIRGATDQFVLKLRRPSGH